MQNAAERIKKRSQWLVVTSAVLPSLAVLIHFSFGAVKMCSVTAFCVNSFCLLARPKSSHVPKTHFLSPPKICFFTDVGMYYIYIAPFPLRAPCTKIFLLHCRLLSNAPPELCIYHPPILLLLPDIHSRIRIRN